jgi:hypothetical protein
MPPTTAARANGFFVAAIAWESLASQRDTLDGIEAFSTPVPSPSH